MALNLETIGKPSEPLTFSYTWKDVALYALGVGAGPDELEFLYEGRGPKVLPTFAVVPAFAPMFEVVQRTGAPLSQVLHGEQLIRVHRPIPPAGTLSTRSSVLGIYDKGKAALIVVECKTADQAGQPLFDNQFSIFVRGEGGFGGERGPETANAEPPLGKAPDFEITETTSPSQALLYRLNGDLNPLHADPAFAKGAGFERPILHGLCTYGYAGRAILRGVCEGDPARLRSLGARFSGVVLPGDAITTRGWRVSPSRYVLTVTNQAGKAVLSHGSVELA